MIAETNTTESEPIPSLPDPKQGCPTGTAGINSGLVRVVIENVAPAVNNGEFPIKRVVGETVEVQADIFADGHDILGACVKYRHQEQPDWLEAPLRSEVNDVWRGSFTVERLGIYFYTVEAWVNRFRSWRLDLEKKFVARMDVSVELQSGRPFFEAAAHRATGPEADELRSLVESLAVTDRVPLEGKVMLALSSRAAELVDTWSERLNPARYTQELRVTVDPVRARFSAWYELFPRSCASSPGKHGTLKNCAEWLPQIAERGFDIVYLPPVHPIGCSFRKGRNNALAAGPGDPGSPWAIGSAAGGHKAVHPELGTITDFEQLVQKANALGIQIALDIAFQCSPDHPYVREHPEWFRHRPDGSIQYAENPPKKYQDIYPLNFECEEWPELWQELKSIFDFWIKRGVRVFRVDNPHTKPFRFWRWCLGELKSAHPDLIFLSEAFTRPKVMYHLAKLGFTQSYNYFPWRNTKQELTRYFTELTQTNVREFFRPNLWPNTPDILTQYLQYGGRAAFMSRLILAATLGASYGIYGPPFEACESQPREPGSEEYFNSDKYEIRHWDPVQLAPLRDLVTRVNAIRRQHRALQSNESLVFHHVDNEQLIAYSKHSQDHSDVILTVVNLDPHHTHRGWVRLDARAWGFSPRGSYQVHELLTNERYIWSGKDNFVELNPVFVPGHIFLLRRYVRTEHDFDYFA